MGTIEKKLIDLSVKEKNISGIDPDILDRLEKSMKDYNTLIKNGITKPRGYNLLTIDSIMPSLEFNRF